MPEPAGHNPARNSSSGPRSWHKRGYLPHNDAGTLIQAITYRLADSLPAEVLAKLDQELPLLPENTTERRRRIEGYLDAGHGVCWLKRPDIARIVIDGWRHFDSKRYQLIEWVIMPNHVHVLVQLVSPFSLPTVVHGWKSFSAHLINRALGRKGAVWQADYWDRFMRDREHLAKTAQYIRENPVKAGLAARPEDWPWSSAAQRA